MEKNFKSVLTLLTGTGGAQLISLLFTPLLTRIFTPEAFGHLGIFVSLAALIVPIAALTLPMVIVLSKFQREAKQITFIACKIAFIVSFVILLLIYLNIEYLTRVLQFEDNGHYLYWIPFVVLFSAFLQLSENWAIRLSLFRLKAKVSILHACIINFLKLLLGLLSPTAAMLIFVAIINPLINMLLHIILMTKSRTSSYGVLSASTARQKFLIKKYQQFSLFQAPQALLNALSQSAPVIAIAAFFGPAAAGFYTFSRGILSVPIILIGKAVGDVFYRRIAEQINQKKYHLLLASFTQATLSLTAVGIVPLTLLLVWAPEFFVFTFGDNWQKAGVYAQYLSLWTFFILINSPSLKLLIALNKQNVALLINIFSTGIRVAVLIIGGVLLKDEWFTLQLFVLFSIAHNTIIIAVAYICAKKCAESARLKLNESS